MVCMDRDVRFVVPCPLFSFLVSGSLEMVVVVVKVVGAMVVVVGGSSSSSSSSSYRESIIIKNKNIKKE